jgi:hypothetical protein
MRSSTFRRFTWQAAALVALLITLSPRTAQADLQSTASVMGTYETCSQSGSSSASCQTTGSEPLGLGSATFGGEASAHAAYGELGTAASALAGCSDISAPYNCYDFNSGISLATAQFLETFNITNGPASGFLVFHGIADGSSSLTCVGPDSGFVCGNYGGNTYLDVTGGSINGITGNYILANGTSFLNIIIPFTPADLITSNLSSVETTFGLVSGFGCAATDDTTCNGFSNFYNTFVITGLSVEGSNGVVDPNAIVTSASGTNYNDLTSVPEPNFTFPLVLLASGISVSVHRRKSKKPLRGAAKADPPRVGVPC